MEKMNERVKMGMLEVKWILIDEDNTIDEKWSYYDSTYAMQVPGGVVVRHSRRDITESQPTTSSSMCFVPMVTLQIEDGKVFFQSSLGDVSLLMSESVGKAIHDQMKKLDKL